MDVIYDNLFSRIQFIVLANKLHTTDVVFVVSQGAYFSMSKNVQFVEATYELIFFVSNLQHIK